MPYFTVHALKNRVPTLPDVSELRINNIAVSAK